MTLIDMRKHYDFSNSGPNPYVRELKKQITIRLDDDTIDYFKGMARQKGARRNPISTRSGAC